MKELRRIQQELSVPKGQKNTFGNYNYRSCEDILEAVKPLLGTTALVLSDEIVMSGERFYVKATAKLFTGTESIENTAFAREATEKKGMDAAQITGAASSYARKYALAGLFLLDDNKDADTMDNSTEAKAYTPKVHTAGTEKKYVPAYRKISDDEKKFRESLDAPEVNIDLVK